MISYEEAYEQMMATAAPRGTESVDLSSALGRVLAQDVVSDMDMPPFNKSAMDGYACRRDDLANAMTVVEEIPAGKSPTQIVGPGQCAKIMTGAPVPEGADCVIMVEFTESVGDQQIRFTGKETSTNICLKAEDLQEGQVVLRTGELLSPARLAVLATVGCTQPLVRRQPRVGIIATGSELVEPGEKADGACIRNSNSTQLCAQCQAMNVTATYYGIGRDTVESIDALIKQAQAENDLIILSGGVSMGDYDLVPGILKENGFEFLFDSVAMQPGRPTIFGRADRCYCCGLPGNPVSGFVVFERMLKPFLYRLMGHHYQALEVVATLEAPYNRRKTKRQNTVPVVFTSPGTVRTVEYHGSAHINAMGSAHGYITIPVGVSTLKEGSPVHVRPL